MDETLPSPGNLFNSPRQTSFVWYSRQKKKKEENKMACRNESPVGLWHHNDGVFTQPKPFRTSNSGNVHSLWIDSRRQWFVWKEQENKSDTSRIFGMDVLERIAGDRWNPTLNTSARRSVAMVDDGRAAYTISRCLLKEELLLAAAGWVITEIRWNAQTANGGKSHRHSHWAARRVPWRRPDRATACLNHLIQSSSSSLYPSLDDTEETKTAI